MPPKAKVTKDHKTNYPNPIKITQGEKVKVGRTDKEHPGWIWCTTDSKVEGWVPEKYLTINNNNSATAKIDYDATEMNVNTGETVNLHQEESGWVWCEKESGQKGWVPLENLSWL